MKKKGLTALLSGILVLCCLLSGCSSEDGSSGPLEGAKDLFENAREAVMSVIGGVIGGDSKSEDTVAVQSVSMLAGIGAYGIQDRYSGMVVAQQTQEINKQEDRTVKELKVSVGDTVKKGDVLFTYDVDEMKLAIDTGKLELEKIQNSITSTNKQIAQLEKDKAKASQSDQLSYSIEIQSLQADVKEYEYQLQTKTVAQELLEKTLGNVDVLATIDGVVQSINDGTQSDDDYGTGSSAYIVLMETGNYRIKGTINEMNRAAMIGMEGQRLIIRSRVDASEIWYGKLDKVDTENPVQRENDYYGGDESSQSTNYPFYVSLDNSDGLMMGQHVYIELDQGQTEQRTGIWLPSYFIDLDGGAYIWAATSRDKLEKRTVKLGDYDRDLDQYEVLDGITASDYIAIADVSLREGMPVTRYDEAYFEDDEDWDDEEWNDEEEDGVIFEGDDGEDEWEDDWGDGDEEVEWEEDVDLGDVEEIDDEEDDDFENEEGMNDPEEEADDVIDLGKEDEMNDPEEEPDGGVQLNGKAFRDLDEDIEAEFGDEDMDALEIEAEKEDEE